MTKDIDHISKKEFIAKLESYRKGSITRRHFLNVTGPVSYTHLTLPTNREV